MTRSAAQVSRDFIDTHPSVKDGIKYGIVNYSALTRMIMEQEGLKNEEAVLVACRRYGESLKGAGQEDLIREVLKESALEVKTKISIITARNDWDVIVRLEGAVGKMLDRSSVLQVLQGTASITVITDDNHRKELEDLIGNARLIKSTPGLVQLTVKSPEDITDTKGVLAYLANALAGRGINAVEVMSCYTDTIFMLEEDDMTAAFGALKRALG